MTRRYRRTAKPAIDAPELQRLREREHPLRVGLDPVVLDDGPGVVDRLGRGHQRPGEALIAVPRPGLDAVEGEPFGWECGRKRTARRVRGNVGCRVQVRGGQLPVSEVSGPEPCQQLPRDRQPFVRVARAPRAPVVGGQGVGDGVGVAGAPPSAR